METPLYPTPKKGAEIPPEFSAHVYCGQTAAWIRMPLGMKVGLGLRDIVFDVDPATPRKRAHPPHPILAHVYCGQMAGWMKTPLGMKVDRGPGHIVLDGSMTSLVRSQSTPTILTSGSVVMDEARNV